MTELDKLEQHYLLEAAANLTMAALIIDRLMEKAPLGFKERNDYKKDLASMKASYDHIMLLVNGVEIV
jgi:hypothetical protein